MKKTKTIKVNITPEEYERFVSKAKKTCGSSRGSLTRFIEKICNDDLIFFDNNMESFLSRVNMKVK